MRVLGLCAALFLAVLIGDPAPAAPLGLPGYFPVGPGWVWVYRTHDGPEVTMRVSGRQQIEGWSCSVIETVLNGFVTQAECYRVTAGGVYAHQRSYPAGTVRLTPPQPMMTAPVQVGRTWRWDGQLGDQPVTVDFTWARQESVTTPAGTFAAMQLYFATPPGADLQFQTWRWFAPGVGMVKEDTTLAQGSASRRVYAELVKVVRGK